MLTYNEVIELRDKLASGEIGLESAQAQYWKDFKPGQKSWHTKDWQERRSKIIKDKCEICGSKETLTLQHLSHPGKYAEYSREVTSTYAREYMNTNPQVDKDEFRNYILKNYDYVPVLLCPTCRFFGTINERVRKLPKYRCSKCRQEFDEPAFESLDKLISIFYDNEDAIEVRDKCFISRQWGTKNHLSNIRYWLQRERAKNRDAETIEKEAFLLYLTDSIKYLSFDDTITACKKCAYYFDIKKMELCSKCKVYYKGIQYPTCIQCLPDEKRKAALEIIEFGKGWQAMHEELGID